MTPRRDNSPFAGKPVPIVPVNVARTVVERERDLALTDSQRTQIVLIQRRLDSTTAPLLRKLDSVRPTWRPANGLNDLSQEQRNQLLKVLVEAVWVRNEKVVAIRPRPEFQPLFAVTLSCWPGMG